MSNQLISVLSTGGTVSTVSSGGQAIPSATAAEIAESLGIARVRARDVLTASSREIGPSEIWKLAQAIEREIETGATGILVTHGTDTLEETAYGLALVLPRRVPVVLTGAMRPPFVAGADGPANVHAAALAASSPALAAYGPVVVMHDEVHLASFVTKIHSARAAAFGSPSAGPIGQVLEEEVVLLLGPSPQEARLSRAAAPNKRVELVALVGGDDGLAIESAAERSDGLVLAAVGAGHMSTSAARAAERAVDSGVAVILASRCVDGLVMSRTYGGAGSETQLIHAGLVRSRFLSPAKARLRLLFGLSAGMSAHDLFPANEPKRKDDE
jgi:L-asparaginase